MFDGSRGDRSGPELAFHRRGLPESFAGLPGRDDRFERDACAAVVVPGAVEEVAACGLGAVGAVAFLVGDESGFPERREVLLHLTLADFGFSSQEWDAGEA
ncbi:hypothetical protein AB0D90_14705 [Streptomyces althioticus]|uniref:hypothetical protein n=1 Tax=Streptomyces althioticus TaxID=83380 RepID=UPI00340D8C23